MNIKKFLTAAAAVCLVAALSVCGTLAYLTHETEAVQNTFSVGSIFVPPDVDPDAGITLYENEPVKQDDGSYVLDMDVEVQAADYESIIPDSTLPKNPTIDVEGLAADAYVFVKIVDATDDTLTYAVDSNWTKLDVTTDEGESVYAAPMLTGSTEGSDWSSSVLADDQVVISADAEEDLGTLCFYGYICQAQGFADATEAWNACFAEG